MTPKRILGIDVGTKRIGLAQSDPTFTFASPIGTFSEGEILAKLTEMQSFTQQIVVGWPLSMRGQEGAATQMVEKFVTKLHQKFPEIPVETLDERFTSTMANQVIRESVPSKKKRQQKGLVDTIAAAILLQSFLDRRQRLY
jgi:putative Holliday junction resolvase